MLKCLSKVNKQNVTNFTLILWSLVVFAFLISCAYAAFLNFTQPLFSCAPIQRSAKAHYQSPPTKPMLEVSGITTKLEE